MTDRMTPEQRHRCMAAIKGKNTKPELVVRRYLHARGLRFRLHNKKLPGCPDIVLKKHKAVVMVNGCFWHGHTGCEKFKLPTANREFWKHKITLNQARDYRAEVELKLLGWKVLRVWGCELEASRRAETLARLYDAIVEAGNSIEQEPLPIAAEPLPKYGK